MTSKFICTDKDFQFEQFPDENYKVVSTEILSRDYPCPYNVIHGLHDNFIKYLGHYACLTYIKKFACNEPVVCIYPNNEYLDTSTYEINPNEVMLPFPVMENMEDSFADEHDLNDLKICESIIDELYPDYTQPYDEINGYYPAGIFIMNKHDFNSYCEFVYNIIKTFFSRISVADDYDIDYYLWKKTESDDNVKDCFIKCIIKKITTIFYMTYFKDFNVIHKNMVKI